MTRNDARDNRQGQTATQRPYRAPRLLVYGAMRELTAGGTSGVAEGTSKAMDKDKG